MVLIARGPREKVSQWLEAVRPNSVDIVFSDSVTSSVRAFYTDEAHLASAVASAVVLGVAVEKESSGFGFWFWLGVPVLLWAVWKSRR